MGWRLRPKPKRVPGEYPEQFVKQWMAATLPTTTPAEAASAVSHLKTKGWTEEQVAEFILPYMPREPEPAAGTEGAGASPLRSSDGRTFSWASDGQPVSSPSQQPGAAPGGDPDPALLLPADVTRSWLDEHLPQMDRRRLRLVVEELERRGWPPGAVAMAVLPHLMPKLSAADRRAVVAGLAKLGMDGREIARATRTA